MSFEYWLTKQRNRNDWVGDLAVDFIRTGERCFIKSIAKYSLCDGAKEALKEAIEEFLLSNDDKTALARSKVLTIWEQYISVPYESAYLDHV